MKKLDFFKPEKMFLGYYDSENDPADNDAEPDGSDERWSYNGEDYNDYE